MAFHHVIIGLNGQFPGSCQHTFLWMLPFLLQSLIKLGKFSIMSQMRQNKHVECLSQIVVPSLADFALPSYGRTRLILGNTKTAITYEFLMIGESSNVTNFAHYCCKSYVIITKFV